MALNVCFVGAGTVNFGGSNDPWNHSLRLENLGVVKIVAIVDPLKERADRILAEKLSGSHAHLYQNCTVYSEIVTALKEKKIDVAFVGKLFVIKREWYLIYKSRIKKKYCIVNPPNFEGVAGFLEGTGYARFV